MDIVAEVVSLAPVGGYLTTAWKLFKLIQDSIDRVKESRHQFSFLAWTIEELLRVLDEGSEPGLSGLTSTSSTINNLHELLEEINDFIKAEGQESFIKLLVTKEHRISQIDAYQKKIAALASVFQISALLDVAKWQVKNDAAKVEDRNVLYARLDELERDQELLRKTLETHQEGMAAMMIAFQTRLQQQLDDDRERQFFSTSVAYLQTTSGRRVKIQDWTVSSFDVQFMRSIASGGFGEVLLGKWQQTEVALKVLKTVNGITPSSMVLETEINIWSKMRHPHILPFLGANVWGDRPFIIMPYLKNGNAREYIHNYPECNRAAILHQASLGLVYLHGKNIVHADLKGYNILIDDSGKALLCDFGLSRVKTNINSQSIAAGDEEICGSINWMAPERLLGRSLRKPSDIYSFGMTIYEIFTNEVPLAGVLRVAFTQLVAQGSLRPEKPSPDGGAPHLTDEIWAIAERCWAHEPSNRPLAKDICNSLEEMANPCISDSTPPLSGTTSQIVCTLAPPEAGPSSGREGSASREKYKPVLPEDRAEILPVTSVHFTREVVKEDLVPEDPRKATPYGSPSGGSKSVEVHNFSPKDRVVIVMGPTGSGKSTFVDCATQQNGTPIRHSLTPHTSLIQSVRISHPKDKEPVVFVDTPGFDDTYKSDIDVLSQIAGLFVKVYKEKVSLLAIVYLHRISDNRMAGTPLRNLQMFTSMCGQAAMPRIVLGTTMWSHVKNPETADRREQELKTTFWADMIAQGSTVQRFDHSYESAWKLIGEMPAQPGDIILSREIYDDKKGLNETTAGVKLKEQLNKLISDQKAATRRLEEHMRKQDNDVLIAELQRQQEEIEQKIDNATVQLQTLKIPLGRKIGQFFAGRKPRK